MKNLWSVTAIMLTLQPGTALLSKKRRLSDAAIASSIDVGGRPNGISAVGSYAYLAASSGNRLTIVDVSDPTSPTIASLIGDSTTMPAPNSVFVLGSYAYVTSPGGDKLVIVDVSDPTSPTIASSIGDSTTMPAPNSVFVLGSYAYVTSEGGSKLVIVDVSDPTSPTIASSIGDHTTMNVPYDLSVVGYTDYTYAYVVAAKGSKLVIVDVSDPSSPTIASSIGDYTTMPDPNSVFVLGSYAYVTSSSGSKLVIVDVSDPTSPTIASSIASSMNVPGDVSVVGSYAYVTARAGNELVIVDVSDPTSPTIASSIGDSDTMSGPRGLSVVGQYAYVAANSGNKLVIVDISHFAPAAGTSGDPHMLLPMGGRADIRGQDGKRFALLSAPNISVAAETTKSDFQQKMGKQTVHGTHFTKAFFTLRTQTAGTIVHLTITAAITPWFPPYATVAIAGETAKPRKIAFGAKQTTRFELEDVSVVAESGSHVVVRAAGWSIKAIRRPLWKPLPGSKTRNYLNILVQTAGADPRGAHGILGQAFDQAALGRKVEGKLDDYNGTEVTTRAQAEGAIEGVYTDYMIASPFDTNFKYSRFDADTSPLAANRTSAAPALSASAHSEEEDA